MDGHSGNRQSEDDPVVSTVGCRAHHCVDHFSGMVHLTIQTYQQFC